MEPDVLSFPGFSDSSSEVTLSSPSASMPVLPSDAFVSDSELDELPDDGDVESLEGADANSELATFVADASLFAASVREGFLTFARFSFFWNQNR